MILSVARFFSLLCNPNLLVMPPSRNYKNPNMKFKQNYIHQFHSRYIKISSMNDFTMNNLGKNRDSLAFGELSCTSDSKGKFVVTSIMVSTSDDGWGDA
jgi:hypothetical protein